MAACTWRQQSLPQPWSLGRHFSDCFIVIGSIGVTVRHELARKTRPRMGSSSRDFIG